MKILRLSITFILTSFLVNCASGYKLIEPKAIDYVYTSKTDSITLEYKYDLLHKKYEKKEIKKGIKLVAIKVTNNSDKDITFGRDVTLAFSNRTEMHIMEPEKTYKRLKQSPATHLLYLLLTPINFYTTSTDSNGFTTNTSSTPIGLVLGPALAGGNMIAASSANKKFKSELLDNNIYGSVIKKGETKFGLIGIQSDGFESLQLNVK